MSNDNRDDRPHELTVMRDRAEIRSWAEARDLIPAYVDAEKAADLESQVTGGKAPTLVQRDELGENYEESEWDSFFSAIQEAGLVLTYRNPPAEEGPGHYALVEQEKAEETAGADMRKVGQPSSNMAPGSAMSDPGAEEVAERERIATELVSREVEAVEWVDDETVELQVEEVWLLTEELLVDEGDERRTVERDVSQLRRLIANVDESEVLESGIANREVIEQESAGVSNSSGTASAGETGSGDRTPAEGIPTETGVTGETGSSPAETAREGTPPNGETPPTHGTGTDDVEPAGESSPQADSTPGTDEPAGTADATVSEHDEGKSVVDATGSEIGIVTDVRGGDVYIDPDPDIVEKVAAKLGWSQADEESYTIKQEDVATVRHDAVELAPLEGMDR